MKKVYLSFAEQDAQKVSNLISLLRSSDYDLDFYDGPDSEELSRAIGEKIIKCDITVCLISDNSYKSKWVDCQLQKSRNKGNRIIVMALKGIKDAVLPTVIKEGNLTFYPWDPQHLKELIAQDTHKHFNNST